MKFEKALLHLKKGKSIKRIRKTSSVILHLEYGKYIWCKYIYESGKEFTERNYKITKEDLNAENWEILDEII